MKNIPYLLILCIALTSCNQRLFNFTIISTKNIELSKLSSLEKSNKRVEGEDMAHLIIFIPTNIIRIDQAIDNTIESIPGCVALLDGVVYSKIWWIPYIYGQQRYVVEATPLIDPAYSSITPVIPKYGKVTLDENGLFKSMESISEHEYLTLKEKIGSSSVKRLN